MERFPAEFILSEANMLGMTKFFYFYLYHTMKNLLPEALISPFQLTIDKTIRLCYTYISRR